jgi:hypothetical protein
MANLNIIDFPDDIMKKLKHLAVEKEISLRQLTIELLTKAVKKEG